MKIEAGCKAVIVNSANHNGTEVSVRNFIGSHPGVTGDYQDMWEVDTNITDSYGCQVTHVSESKLIRLDEGSRQVVSWDECAWRPVKKSVDA